jgi:Flp pilus assembly protein TadD
MRKVEWSDLLPAGIIVVVAAVVALSHWPVLSSQALLFDDDEYLVHNPLVLHPSWASARRFVSEVTAPSTVTGYYQPLAMLSLMADCALGGTPDNLAAFHRTSLALHVANTALLVWLLYRLFGNLWTAGAIGLLFGVHPMTVEPVAWVGDRKTVLSAFFSLWTLLLYVRYARTERRGYLLAVIVAYLLAVLSKPTAVPLPLALLALDYWPLGRSGKRAWLEKLPLLAIACVFAALTVISQRHLQLVEHARLDIGQALLLASYNVAFYVGNMVWPAALSPLYAFPSTVGFSNAALSGTLIVNVLVLTGCVVCRRWTRAPLVGAAIYVLLLAPTLMNVRYSPSLAWNKYAYLPMVGLLLPVAAMLDSIWWTCSRMPHGHAWKWLGGGVMLLLCGAAFTSTRHYLQVWQDSERLARYMVMHAPNAAAGHNHLAFLLSSRRRLDEAIEEYDKALRLSPTYADAHNNLAAALAAKGRFDEAVQHYRQALQLKPGYAEAHNNLGNVLAARPGGVNEAVQHWAEAARLKPTYAEPRNNLAVVYAAQGRLKEAEQLWMEALRLRPDYAEAHYNLAVVLARQGRAQEAAPHFEAAARSRRAPVRLAPRN